MDFLQYHILDDLEAFLNVMPPRLKVQLKSYDYIDTLIEVVMDLGRVAEARFPYGSVSLEEGAINKEDIEGVIGRVGHFGDDNRAGIERTLHRISVMRNRVNEPIGLTCRVGRAVMSSARLIGDIVKSGNSVLLLGKPGVGKTTMLRDVARVLADEANQRVVIVDTSNEIAGDGDVPHPAIGNARRMQVANTSLQHKVMIEAVENHMPQVIIIDEMSTELEALAARTIAERGVQLVATAHGKTLENVILNPILSDLVGGIQAVTLGDIEARRRRSQKTVLERKHAPTFDVVVEIRMWNHVVVHGNVGEAVDRIVRGLPVKVELSTLLPDETVKTVIDEIPKRDEGAVMRNALERAVKSTSARTSHELSPAIAELDYADSPRIRQFSIYSFGVSKSSLEQVARENGTHVQVTDNPQNAQVFVTTKSHYTRRPAALRDAERDGLPVYVLRRATDEQIKRFLSRFLPTLESNKSDRKDRTVTTALTETENAIEKVRSGESQVVMTPRNAFIRRLQHKLANFHNADSVSTGSDSERRVVIKNSTR